MRLMTVVPSKVGMNSDDGQSLLNSCVHNSFRLAAAFPELGRSWLSANADTARSIRPHHDIAVAIRH